MEGKWRWSGMRKPERQAPNPLENIITAVTWKERYYNKYSEESFLLIS